MITLLKKSETTSVSVPLIEEQPKETVASQLEKQRLMQLQEDQIALQKQILEEYPFLNKNKLSGQIHEYENLQNL